MTKAIAQAATILWSNWQDSTHIDELPIECRPRTRSGGYAIQADVARLSGADVVGWKIAATSAAGQRHINVDGPLAGRLLSSRQLPDGATVPLRNQVMSVAEAEFAFRMGADLPARSHPYAVNEVIDAVESLHPSIEVPDSRFHDPTIVGAPQLIADMACACWFLVGEAAPPAWRGRDLVEHRVVASRNGTHAAEGGGMNVLGDPRQRTGYVRRRTARG
jgi:2-keto-4-pentenoate hydratase